MAAIWPDQKAENTLQLFFIRECHSGKLSVYSFDQKENKKRMQNLLRGEQELRQGVKKIM